MPQKAFADGASDRERGRTSMLYSDLPLEGPTVRPAARPRRAPGEARPSHWRLADIDFGAIDRTALADDPLAFRIVFMASLIETGAEVYAGNLVRYFAGDVELAGWLRGAWEPEELQHGRALRTYVERAWPHVDWQGTFDRFFATYSRTCTVADLAPSPALELAARCMVETGTAALYGALHRHASEPVLKDLAGCIFSDEVRHYKHFYRHFLLYQARERRSRWRVGRTLFARLAETRTGDGEHAYRALEQTVPALAEESYRDFTREVGAFIRANAPPDMPVRMGLKPLSLPQVVEDWIVRHAAPAYAWWTGGALPYSIGRPTDEPRRR